MHILRGVMSCQNLFAHCQKLSYGSLSMLHCHCVSVSHLGLGWRGNHSSVNRRPLPLAQSTDGSTFQLALHIAISFPFLRMTDVNVWNLKTHVSSINNQQDYFLIVLTNWRRKLFSARSTPQYEPILLAIYHSATVSLQPSNVSAEVETSDWMG